MRSVVYKKDVIKVCIKSLSKMEQNMLRHKFEQKLILLRGKKRNLLALKSTFRTQRNTQKNVVAKKNTGKKYPLFLKYNFSIVGLPVKTRKLTILKSPHVHKKAKQHFIKKTYKTIFIIKTLYSRLNASNLVEFQLRNLIKEMKQNLPKSVELSMNWKKYQAYGV